MEKIGRQQDGMWTLGYGVYISTEGKQLAEAECESVWISHVFQGRGIPDASLSCTINTPLSTESLESFLNLLSKHMKHNFMPALLVMSSSAMVLNYTASLLIDYVIVLFHWHLDQVAQVKKRHWNQEWQYLVHTSVVRFCHHGS